jgi:hypothetical protein
MAEANASWNSRRSLDTCQVADESTFGKSTAISDRLVMSFRTSGRDSTKTLQAKREIDNEKRSEDYWSDRLSEYRACLLLLDVQNKERLRIVLGEMEMRQDLSVESIANTTLPAGKSARDATQGPTQDQYPNDPGLIEAK